MTTPEAWGDLAPSWGANGMNSLIEAAPGLAQSPSTVADLFTAGGDAATSGQTVDYTAQSTSVATAAQSHQNKGFLHDIMSGLHYAHQGLQMIPGEKTFEKDVIHPVSQVLSGPLREVQHEYRYIHDVWERHGVLAGLGVAAAGVVGGVAGTLLTGGLGGIVGANLGVELTRPLFSDSYERTKDGSTYRDDAGNPVSFGRDVAGLAFHNRNSTAYKAVSGGLDATFDWFADPFLHGANAFKDYRAATRAGASLERAQAIVGAAYGGAQGVKGLTRVQRVLEDLGQISKAGDIVSKYPSLAPLAGDLAKTKDGLEAAQVFLDQFRLADTIRPWNGTFPSRPALIATADDWRQALKAGRAPQDYLPQTAQDVLPKSEEGILARVAAVVGNKQPAAVDETTAKLSNTTFDPSSPLAHEGVFRAARRVYGERGARNFLSVWVDANLATKKNMWENLATHSFIRDGITDDATLRLVQEKAGLLTKGPGEGTFGSYAHDIDGNDLSVAYSPAGDASIQAGLLEDHVGQFTFPNFAKMHDTIAGLKKLYSIDRTANSTAINYYIDQIFKPFAIGTAASGFRVASNEILTYGMKEGWGNYLKALTASMKGKIGVADEKAARAGFRSVVAKAAPVLNRNDPDLIDTANRLAVDGGINNVAGHRGPNFSTIIGDMSNGADEHLGSLVNAVPEGKKFGTRWLDRRASDAEQPFAHRAQLREYLQPTGQAALQGLQTGLKSVGKKLGQPLNETERGLVLSKTADSVEEYLRSPAASSFTEKMARTTSVTDPASQADPIRQWAETVARSLEGATAYRNADGLTVHNPLYVKPLLNGELPDINRMLTEPVSRRVQMVKGLEFVPPATASGLRRVVNGTFGRFFEPIVRNLSRNPLYVAAVHKSYQDLTELYKGAIDDDAIWQAAKVQATRDIMPMLHNPLEKTQLEYATKNLAPFFFAQRQQMARYGQVLLNNPAGFRKAQLVQQSMRNIGFIHKDDQGKDVFVYPGFGEANSVIAKSLSVFGITPNTLMPVGFSGYVQSLNPGQGNIYPGFGPTVALPMEALAKVFPNEFADIAQKTVGVAQSQPLWAQVLPFKPLQRAIVAYQGDHNQQFNNSFFSVLQAAAAHDEALLAKHPGQDPNTVKGRILPPENASPLEKQRAYNHLKNWTRVHWAFMAAFGFFAPASPQAHIGDQEVQDALRKLADAGKPNTLQAINDYVAAHPEATPYTVYRTHGLADFPLPPSQQAVDYALQNPDFLRKHMYAAAALLPQSTDPNPDARALYGEQLATGIRVGKTPQEFERDLYIKQAAGTFFRLKDAHDKAQAALAHNPTAAKDEMNYWRQVESDFFAMHPVFQQWVTSPDREEQRQLVVRDLRAAFTEGNLPDSPMNSKVAGLLTDYGRHEALMLAARSRGKQYTDAEQANWQNYLDLVAQKDPALQPLINHVFTYIQPDYRQDFRQVVA